jgi:hypothetical protein
MPRLRECGEVVGTTRQSDTSIPQEDSWHPFLLEAEFTLEPQLRLEGLDQLKNPMISWGIEFPLRKLSM